MTLFSANSSVQTACTNVHRPMGGIEGLREVHDDVGRLTVSAFPAAMIKDMSMARAAVPACYVLADHCTAYIGETGNVGRRLSDHYRDQSKAFAREVYVISGRGKGRASSCCIAASQTLTSGRPSPRVKGRSPCYRFCDVLAKIGQS